MQVGQDCSKLFDLDVVNPKGMSPSHMRHVTMSVFSLKFTHVKMKGPKKLIQPQPQNMHAFCKKESFNIV